jgi:PAS domain S-box-containing protein
VGLHWVDGEATILWANKADYEPLGYTKDEYVGHKITEFHADEDVISDILQRLLGGESLYNYKARLLCKDGSTKSVLIASSGLFDDADNFVHTRCFTITEPAAE